MCLKSGSIAALHARRVVLRACAVCKLKPGTYCLGGSHAMQRGPAQLQEAGYDLGSCTSCRACSLRALQMCSRASDCAVAEGQRTALVAEPSAGLATGDILRMASGQPLLRFPGGGCAHAEVAVRTLQRHALVTRECSDSHAWVMRRRVPQSEEAADAY